jgi:hypothetical protein
MTTGKIHQLLRATDRVVQTTPNPPFDAYSVIYVVKFGYIILVVDKTGDVVQQMQIMRRISTYIHMHIWMNLYYEASQMGLEYHIMRNSVTNKIPGEIHKGWTSLQPIV